MKVKIFDTITERFEFFDVILTDRENVLYQNGMNIEEILNEREILLKYKGSVLNEIEKY
jgi:thioredoxin-related protein